MCEKWRGQNRFGKGIFESTNRKEIIDYIKKYKQICKILINHIEKGCPKNINQGYPLKVYRIRHCRTNCIKWFYGAFFTKILQERDFEFYVPIIK